MNRLNLEAQKKLIEMRQKQEELMKRKREEQMENERRRQEELARNSGSDAPMVYTPKPKSRYKDDPIKYYIDKRYDGGTYDFTT